MPMYSYTVKTRGKTKTDVAQANDEDALIAKLQSEGYFIVSVRLAMEKAVLKGDKVNKNFRFDHENVK